MSRTSHLNLLLLTALALPLAACLDDDDDGGADTRSYRIEVTNATYNQPLSPVAAALHGEGFAFWRAGEAASSALEELAEGGDNTALLDAAAASDQVLDSAGGSAPIAPGASETLTLTSQAQGDLYLSVATMLVNTNDAVTGVAGLPLSGLAAGESVAVHGRVYDAGTEANSETAGTIPGPADGGVGFDAARDDRDFVAIHPGVVSADDGLTTSVLDESHRWLGPGCRVRVTRTE
jgi:hypothetical protein